jgi:hypothetical protein
MSYKQALPLQYQATRKHSVNTSNHLEAIMKKLAMMFEDLWVAVAFAEEGIYEAPVSREQQPRIIEPVRIHAA